MQLYFRRHQRKSSAKEQAIVAQIHLNERHQLSHLTLLMKSKESHVKKKRVSFCLPGDHGPSGKLVSGHAPAGVECDVAIVTEECRTFKEKPVRNDDDDEIRGDFCKDDEFELDSDDDDSSESSGGVDDDEELSDSEDGEIRNNDVNEGADGDEDEDEIEEEDDEIENGVDVEEAEDKDEVGNEVEDGGKTFRDRSDSSADSEGENTVANLDHDDAMEVNEGDSSTAPNSADPVQTFSGLNLDPRLERAVEQMGWKKPTSVQGAVLPNAIRGRDVLVAAPTGSGKTASYAIPAVQHVCQAIAVSKSSSRDVRAIVLVPTRELAHQVTSIFKCLCRFITGIRVSNSATDKRKKRQSRKHSNTGESGEAHTSASSERWNDIIVGTPASVNSLSEESASNPFKTTSFVVVDEADLVLGYGYEKDVRSVLSKISSSAQCLMLSATLDVDNMDKFRGAVLRNPLVVKINSTMNENLDEFVIRASHYVARLRNSGDRYLVTYAMLRLNVLCGKVLIFVNHVNSAFRLKLFLDQFKIKSAVLNAELPANSRIHCVQQFNAGIFDILIAADVASEGSDARKPKRERTSGKFRRASVCDDEFGLSRGVDFKDVAAVLNFDLPDSADSYTHRAGRTARGGKSGTILTLVCSDQEEANVMKTAVKIGIHVGPLAFRMEQVEPFRYRVEDCLRLITDTAIRGARLADVRREMETSEQLKGYFENRPEDLDALQHSFRLAKNVAEHLGHVPNYLLPAAFRNTSTGTHTSGGVKGRKTRMYQHSSLNKRRKEDPLKAFSVRGSSRARFQNRNGIQKKRTEQTMATMGRKKHRGKRNRS